MLISRVNWLLLIAMILGNTVIKPAGGFVFHMIVAGFAAIVMVVSNKRGRIAGGVMMVVALTLAAVRYPEYKAAQEIYRRSLEAASQEILKTHPSPSKRYSDGNK